eukprot:TRINITY_DN2413_c0_g1_i1.p1 TRINITY_DN2413_c0_g1~~TRINITY_DN2413_c0_g1_i1.p1  ORF type:complete len:196 (+),score=27.64 TRINITY_DN2413_c0_g1_i1:234-821(+)
MEDGFSVPITFRDFQWTRTISGKECKITITDSENDTKGRVLPFYLCDTHGVFILSDLLKPRKEWEEEIRNNIAYVYSCYGHAPLPLPEIVVLGTKADTDIREISINAQHIIFREFGLRYFEVSSKFNINISESVNHLISRVIFKHSDFSEFKKEINMDKLVLLQIGILSEESPLGQVPFDVFWEIFTFLVALEGF